MCGQQNEHLVDQQIDFQELLGNNKQANTAIRQQ